MTIQRRRGTADRQDSATLTLAFVEVAEKSAPKGTEPLLWRLVTTLPIATLVDAQDVVRLYRLRHAGRGSPA